MKVAVSPIPPPVVVPPREVTIVMTEQEARDLKLFLGLQAFQHYNNAFTEATRSRLTEGVLSAQAMQSTGDSLWRSLKNVV